MIATLFQTRKLDFRPIETTCYLGQNSLMPLPSTSSNKEVVTSLSYVSRLAATGKEPRIFKRHILRSFAVFLDLLRSASIFSSMFSLIVLDLFLDLPPFSSVWKATKEYLSHRGTNIRVLQVCFRVPFLGLLGASFCEALGHHLHM